MEDKKHPSPAEVAEAFVKQYYVILHKSPDNLHKFYQESSLQGWPGADGVVTPVTTLSGINKKVMASDYKYCSADVKTTDAQESLGGGIIVSVTGFLTRKDDVKYQFCQTFFLAKQEKGFYVLNDILRFFDVWESTTEAADENHAESSASTEACEGPAPLNFKAAIQNGKVEEASDLLVSMKNPSTEKSGETEMKEKVWPVVKPATIVKVPSVVMPAVNVAPKITYASVLAKETTAVSPRVASVNVAMKEAMSPKAIAAFSPRGDASPKAPTLPSRVAPRSPKGGQGSPSTSVNTDARGIYIGGLPYDITRQGVVEVVKQFGPVRRFTDTVQIRRHEDGFCCGFVEFESADSAWRAVQAHHVMFGEKEAYILYKRPTYNRGSSGRARSPTRRGPNPSPISNTGASERDDWIHRRPRQASRERLK